MVVFKPARRASGRERMSSTDSSATAKPSSSSSSTPQELTSILSQVQHLQSDRERLIKELEEAREKMSKLQEGKRDEMKRILDTVINKWLQDSVNNEDARKQFSEGMQRLVNDTRENNGVWTVACEASNLHAKQVEEIERLRVECESLRALSGGQFKDEASRKRSRDPNPGNNDFWGEFDLGDDSRK